MDLTFIPIAGLLIAVLGLAYAWYRDRRGIKRELEKERTYKKAAKDHGLAVRWLQIISSRLFDSGGRAYQMVFQDADLRQRIEIYLGFRKTLFFESAKLSQDQLGNPECCKTIEDVIAAVEAFKKESPSEAKKLGLL